MKKNRTQALQLLQTALANPNAEFRDGQWEAIVDLDFAFQGAVRQGLVDGDSDSELISECKNIFTTNTNWAVNK